jgi:hypothetical protein
MPRQVADAAPGVEVFGACRRPGPLSRRRADRSCGIPTLREGRRAQRSLCRTVGTGGLARGSRRPQGPKRDQAQSERQTRRCQRCPLATSAPPPTPPLPACIRNRPRRRARAGCVARQPSSSDWPRLSHRDDITPALTSSAALSAFPRRRHLPPTAPPSRSQRSRGALETPIMTQPAPDLTLSPASIKKAACSPAKAPGRAVTWPEVLRALRDESVREQAQAGRLHGQLRSDRR